MPSTDAELDRIALGLRSCFQTMKQAAYWQRVCERAKINIERPAAAILYVLNEREHEEIGVQQLAKWLHVEAPTVTRQTQALENAGYIERLRSTSDHRAVSLKLTSDGKQLAKKLWQAQREQLIGALRDWPLKDREQLAVLLERLSTSLGKS